jgi:membrane protein
MRPEIGEIVYPEKDHSFLAHSKSMAEQSIVRFFKRYVAKVIRSRVSRLLLQTSLKWQRDNCMDMGAALAYYALFSLIPTVLVILSIFGFLVGPNTYIYSQIFIISQEILPPVASQIFMDVLVQLNQDRIGVGVVGFVLLLIAASSFFTALDRTFDIIWETSQRSASDSGINEIALAFIRRKIFSFVLVLGAGGLLIISLLSNIIIRVILRLIQEFSDQFSLVEIDTFITLQFLQLISSFLILTAVLMVLFKALPSVRVTWRDVVLGALITATLFLMLQNLVSRSVINFGSQFNSYGVVGGVMVLMLWIYLTSQIFFWGGEFTYVYAKTFGSRRIKPHRSP